MKNNNFLIVGFGAEGGFALSYLKNKYPEAAVAVADQKNIKVPSGIKLYRGKNYLKDIIKYQTIVRSPSVSPDLPEFKRARGRGQVITSLTKLFFSECQGKIIGVTGTKGKSTTATLIYEVLKRAGKDVYLVGNIGQNPFKYLGENQGRGRIFVYELSSYQLAELDKSPEVAVFLDIFPDHLPWHGSFKKYQAAKANIAKFQKADNYFIYNSGYAFIRGLAAKAKAKKVDYLKECKIAGGHIYFKKEKIIGTSKVKLLGRHNLENICAVVCAAKLFKVKNSVIASAVENFSGLCHRLELARNFKGVLYYDDAISTTPESTLAAMDVFKQNIGTIILGGLDRGYNFHNLAKGIFKYRIGGVVLFPESGRRIWSEIVKVYKQAKEKLPQKLVTRDMGAAVKFAYKNCHSGQVCLLSTASPSYSLFKNYIEKGNLFKKEVKKLK